MLFANREYHTGMRYCLWRWKNIEDGYLLRLHLFQCPLFCICFHFYSKGDPHRAPHDHPVTFLSLIIRGHYVEWRNGTYHARHWFNFIKADFNDIHKIIWVAPKTTTLCFMGPRVREWGFHTPEGWVQWQEYYKSLGKPIAL